jgi:predicted transcriptional regulator
MDGIFFSRTRVRAVCHYIKKKNGARTHTRNLTHAQHNADGWVDVTKHLKIKQHVSSSYSVTLIGSARKVSNQEKYSTNNFNICNYVGCYGILSKVFRGRNPKS